MDENNISELVPAVDVTDDREARSKFWIAIYTRPRSEKKVATGLSKLGIELYVPIQKQLKTWSDRKKFVDVPVIPMILFANISDDEIIKIKQQSLILKIISYPGRKEPAHIPKEQIDNLKYMLDQSEIKVSFEHGQFETNEIVKIIRGKLKGLIGQVREVKNDMTEIWMSIDLLGGAVIKIKTSELERLK